MELRLAKDEELDALVEMTRIFHEQTAYGQQFAFSDEQIRKTILWVMEQGAVFVIENDLGQLVGEFGVVVVPQMFSGAPTASEVFWWTHPLARGCGKRLFDAAVEWAKTKEATSMQLVSPNDRVDLLYQRLGCQKLETVFRLAL